MIFFYTMLARYLLGQQESRRRRWSCQNIYNTRNVLRWTIWMWWDDVGGNKKPLLRGFPFIFMSMSEKWKTIEGFETYEVSTEGRIRNKHGRILKTWKRNGYVNVELQQEKKPYKFRVHRLVASAFIPNPEMYPEVHHKNHIRDDNRLINLQWTTSRGNSIHRWIKCLENAGYKVIGPDRSLAQLPR